MTKIEINAERALSLLEEVVAERGSDYRYEPLEGSRSCVYQFDGKPHCAVGLALFKAGVSAAILKEMDSEPETDITHIVMGGDFNQEPFLEDFNVFIDEGATSVFASFQEAQDEQEPYGFAMAHTKENM